MFKGPLSSSRRRPEASKKHWRCVCVKCVPTADIVRVCTHVLSARRSVKTAEMSVFTAAGRNFSAKEGRI